jgi:hypothetical protein
MVLKSQQVKQITEKKAGGLCGCAIYDTSDDLNDVLCVECTSNNLMEPSENTINSQALHFQL